MKEIDYKKLIKLVEKEETSIKGILGDKEWQQ